MQRHRTKCRWKRLSDFWCESCGRSVICPPYAFTLCSLWTINYSTITVAGKFKYYYVPLQSEQWNQRKWRFVTENELRCIAGGHGSNRAYSLIILGKKHTNQPLDWRRPAPKNYRDYSYKFVQLLIGQINSLHYEFMFLRTGCYFMPTRHSGHHLRSSPLLVQLCVSQNETKL